jgi:hypothetical protein
MPFKQNQKIYEKEYDLLPVIPGGIGHCHDVV